MAGVALVEALLPERVFGELDLARSEDDLLAVLLLFARFAVGLGESTRSGRAWIDQKLLVLVIAPREYLAVSCHGEALLVTCVDLANLLVLQRPDLCRPVLDGDDLLFGLGVLAAVAVEDVDFDVAGLA